MTVTEQRRRPSPTPRTETPPKVTERVTETCNAEAQVPAVERETAPSGPNLLQSAITHGERLWVRSRGYWTLPPLLTEHPPTADTITAYARRAGYTGTTGPKRAAGILWAYSLAIPTLAASRLWAWTWERPGRLVTVAVTVKLLSFTPPFAWTVDHLIKPGVNAALWLFL